MSRINFITLDKFLETKNNCVNVKKRRRNSKLYFFPENKEKFVWLIFKGQNVLDLKIFNLTPDKINLFDINNPIKGEKINIERRLTKDKKEFFIYQIRTSNGISFVAYLVKWDLSHWSGFSSIQEEKVKDFTKYKDAKNWLETVSGTKSSQMASTIVRYSKTGLDLQLPCKIGLKFSLN